MSRTGRRALWLLVLAGVVGITIGATALRAPSFYVADPPAASAASPAATPSGPVAGMDEPTAASPSPSKGTQTLHAVGLGDSVMSGTNCGCDGIMAEYARELARSADQRVSTQNFGVGGYTTQDVLDDLNGDGAVRKAVAGANVVVIIIGANDLNDDLDQWQNGGCAESCYQPDVTAMGQRLASILAKVAALSHGRAEVLVTDYWNVFTDGRVALANGAAETRFHRAVTAAANREIASRVSTAQDRLVDLVVPFKGAGDGDPTSLLAPDGDHPNAAGVRVIAAALVAAT